MPPDPPSTCSSRAIGFVGHLAEEAQRPMAFVPWPCIEDEACINLRDEAQACASRDRAPRRRR
ncbi:hypothetical protein WT81_27285 [Burkholderia stagnalis]|nr:hypothetical protein WT80_13450 [Burkholderia stagnalis]KWK52271.1 hypothetical protein WT81_27285 [Burkholderia stagnalis]KWN66532.1 hypothetical protein WT90_29250 [Burkholderia stagnalis]